MYYIISSQKSINRSKMLKILAAFGIPKNVVECIDSLYEVTRARQF